MHTRSRLPARRRGLQNKTNLDWSCLDLCFEVESEQQALLYNNQTGSVQSVHISPARNEIRTSIFLILMHAAAFVLQMKSHFTTDCDKSLMFSINQVIGSSLAHTLGLIQFLLPLLEQSDCVAMVHKLY